MDKAKHIPQGLTQRLLDLGVIVFSETVSDCGYTDECYEIDSDFIMICDDRDLATGTVSNFIEVYNDDNGEFSLFKANTWDEDDIDIIKDNIEVYKKIRI